MVYPRKSEQQLSYKHKQNSVYGTNSLLSATYYFNIPIRQNRKLKTVL